MRWRPGDTVLLRSVYGGQVRWAWPHRLVDATDGRLALLVVHGTPGASMGRDADGRYLERWVRGDPSRRHDWHSTNVLRFVRPGDMHTVELFWSEEWRFLGWYVNLQAPPSETILGYDTTDWALDVWIDPDGTWSWKDEDDFAEAQALGVLSPADATAVREEGERVIAEKPWPTGWEDWRPDPAWSIPTLPEGWDVV